MPNWKCSECGYELEADSPPDKCPGCNKNCQFMDNTCYTPDCQFDGVDHRIGKKGE
jgi:rubredoxin